MKVYLWTLYIIFFQTLQLILLGFAVSNINQSFWFHLESGCLLPSLPSNAVFDGTSGIGFICDLNDNIVAPWPTTSYSLPSSCNRSTYKLPPPYHNFSIVLCNIFTVTKPKTYLHYEQFLIHLFLLFMELQLQNFHLFLQQRLHKMVRTILLYFYKLVFQVWSSLHFKAMAVVKYRVS